MTRIRIIMDYRTDLDLDNEYVDPDANDYPYDEQIKDEIVNELAKVRNSAWANDLADGDFTVDIINED